MSKRMQKWISSVVMASVVMLSAPAVHASHQNNNTGGGGVLAATSAILITTYIGLPATTLGGGITLTIVLINAAKDSSDDSETAEKFLRLHAAELQQGIAMGGGEGVQNLADVYRVDERHRDAFAEMLRERRDELLPLTRLSKLTEQRASRFFRIVLRGMKEDPALRGELRDLRQVTKTSDG